MRSALGFAVLVSMAMACSGASPTPDAGSGGGAGGGSGAGGGGGGTIIPAACDAGRITGRWDGGWGGCGADVAVYDPVQNRTTRFDLKPDFVVLEGCGSTPAIDFAADWEGRPAAGARIEAGVSNATIGIGLRCGSTGPEYLVAQGFADGGRVGSLQLRISSAQLVATDGGREYYELRGDLDVTLHRAFLSDGGAQGQLTGGY